MLNVRAIKELRKISGLGVAECRRLLDITGNDVDGALALAPRSKRKPTIEHGSWYASCLRGRAGVYLFKLCADANVHNNRALWALWQACNRAAARAPLDCETALSQVVADGVVLWSCVALRLGAGALGVYEHAKIAWFVYKKIAITLVCSHACAPRPLEALARVLSQHLLCFAAGSQTDRFEISRALREPFVLNDTMLASDVVDAFGYRRRCKVSVQRAVIVA